MELLKFVLLIRKCVYIYEYINNQEKGDNYLFRSIGDIYGNLNLKKNSYSNSKHARKVWNASEMKNINNKYDIYVYNLYYNSYFLGIFCTHNSLYVSKLRIVILLISRQY